MSDHDAPHPIDRTYRDAEATLDDDAARRARRAQVLEAVARESKAAAPLTETRKPPVWRYAGWLTAASVAGLGALIAYQLSPVADLSPAPAPDAVSGVPARSPLAGPPTALDAQAPTPPAPQIRRAPPEEHRPETAQRAAPVAPTPPPPPLAPAAPPPAAAPEAAGGPPPPVAFPSSQSRMESAEGRRAAAAPVAAPAAPPPPPPPPSARVQGAVASPASLGARLRAAAAAGRTSEVAELLADGAPVDARDSDGETALMKSVRAGEAAIVALLRRHGADPDLENRAGVSARQMVEAADSPSLDRALNPSGGAR